MHQHSRCVCVCVENVLVECLVGSHYPLFAPCTRYRNGISHINLRLTLAGTNTCLTGTNTNSGGLKPSEGTNSRFMVLGCHKIRIDWYKHQQRGNGGTFIFSIERGYTLLVCINMYANTHYGCIRKIMLSTSDSHLAVLDGTPVLRVA